MAGSGRKDFASALIITEVLAQDFNDQMTLNIKNPMVALFTFINCLSKLLKAKLDNPEGGVTCFLFVLEDTLEATLHRVFCDAEKKHGQIDGQLRNDPIVL